MKKDSPYTPLAKLYKSLDLEIQELLLNPGGKNGSEMQIDEYRDYCIEQLQEDHPHIENWIDEVIALIRSNLKNLYDESGDDATFIEGLAKYGDFISLIAQLVQDDTALYKDSYHLRNLSLPDFEQAVEWVIVEGICYRDLSIDECMFTDLEGTGIPFGQAASIIEFLVNLKFNELLTNEAIRLGIKESLDFDDERTAIFMKLLRKHDSSLKQQMAIESLSRLEKRLAAVEPILNQLSFLAQNRGEYSSSQG